jgi:hypothetical protein
VSIFGTSDPGTAGQTFFGAFAGDSGCGTFGVDAWLMFSKSKIQNTAAGGSVMHERNQKQSIDACAQQGATVQVNICLFIFIIITLYCYYIIVD